MINEKIAVIIPTYNERTCIVSAIRQIKAHVSTAEIFIVDDNSPDRTAQLVRSKFGSDKTIHIIVREEKAGRGSAVLYGFFHALQNRSMQYFIEMDADLCHNPKYIKTLVGIAKHADIVIASRYLPESKATGWSLKRRFMSRAINAFAKFFLRIPISDYTDGYRCYSRKAVTFLCSQKFKSKGYIVLSEAAYLCFKNGFILKEIPITIHFRSLSKSNLTIQEIKEALITILQLRFNPSIKSPHSIKNEIAKKK